MKIILAHYKYYIQGGPERYMFKFMDLAKEHGCEVIPFSVNFPSNVETEYAKYFVGSKDAGGNYDANNRKISYLLKNVYHEFHNREAYKKLISLIKTEKPDLLYVLIPGQLTPDIFKAAFKMGIPVVLRISDFRLICGKYSMVLNGKACNLCLHGRYSNCTKNKCVKGSKLLSLLRASSLSYHRKHRTYRFVDAVITPPEFTKKLIVEDGFFEEDKIYINPTFIDSESIAPVYSHDNYLLCLGRFAPEKGYKYAIEAMKYLSNENIRLVITGDETDMDEESRRVIRDCGLSDKISFCGFVKGQELNDIIQKSMAVVAPAVWYENMPNTILEAYAYGKPVIASRIGSLSEIVDDGKTGFLFETANSQDLADKIIKLISDEDKYMQLCVNARRKCETNFSKEAHWHNFTSIVGSLKRK